MPYQHYGSALEHYLKHSNFQGPKLELSIGIKGLQVKQYKKKSLNQLMSLKCGRQIPSVMLIEYFGRQRVSTYASQHLDRAFEYQHTLR